jgi:hypothetical protein
MRRIRRYRPSHTTVVAYLSLFLVLTGGTAVALTGSNTVFSDDIKDGEVKRSDVAGGAIAGGKVVDDSLTGDDVNELGLGQVPSAQSADDAEKLDGKDSTAFWAGKSYIATSPETDGGAEGTGTAQSVFCDSGTPQNPGDPAIGGGYSGLSPSEGSVTRTVPTSLAGAAVTQEGWTVEWVNGATTNRNVVIHVRCADMAPLRP